MIDATDDRNGTGDGVVKKDRKGTFREWDGGSGIIPRFLKDPDRPIRPGGKDGKGIDVESCEMTNDLFFRNPRFSPFLSDREEKIPTSARRVEGEGEGIDEVMSGKGLFRQ